MKVMMKPHVSYAVTFVTFVGIVLLVLRSYQPTDTRTLQGPRVLQRPPDPLEKRLPKGLKYHPVYKRKFARENITEEGLFSLLTTPEVICNKRMRAGNKINGGWDVCLEGPYYPREPCLVYSFGIGYDFSFDDAMADTFKCTVRSFDPSMKDTPSHKRGDRIFFKADGVSDRNMKNKKGWPLKTASTLIKENGDEMATIDYLKMDIEGSEWRVIPNLFTSGVMSRVKQFSFELHRKFGGTIHPYNLLALIHRHGFRRWYGHFNPNFYYRPRKYNVTTTRCFELYFVNINLADDGTFRNKERAPVQAAYEAGFVNDFPDYAQMYDYISWPLDLSPK